MPNSHITNDIAYLSYYLSGIPTPHGTGAKPRTPHSHDAKSMDGPVREKEDPQILG